MKPPIRFECPRCGTAHERGYINGVDTFRCLRCGYIGHGFHPDPSIDRAVGDEIREAQAWDVAHGLEPGPFEP